MIDTNTLSLSPHSQKWNLVSLFSSTLLLLFLLWSVCSASVVSGQIYYPPGTTYPPSTTYPYPGSTYPYNSGTYPYTYPSQLPSNTYPYGSNTYPNNQLQNNFPGSIFSQPLSPWFPSIPAVACGGSLFSFTIQGKPHMNVKLVSDDSKQNQKKGLLALQIIAANNGVFFGRSSVTGMIFQGTSNIEHNRGHDFDVKTMFNDCQTLAFSK